LKQGNSIKKIAAFFLLLLFSISIVPKIYFHDVIANHTDAIICDHPQKSKACLHQQGYYCQVNDPVIYSPYLTITINSWCLPEIHFDALPATSFFSFLQDCFLHKESRGPPLG